MGPGMTAEACRRHSIRLRGRSLLALVLAPDRPVDDWLAELDARVLRSPGFFAGRPILLDMSGIEAPTRPELAATLAGLAIRDIRVMAIEGVDAALLDATMPPLLASASTQETRDERPPPPPSRTREPSLLIEEPVRSGQTITFPAGDIIVDGSVASGAEIIAGGSIHIYGALRGRAFAGSTGNARARIFCRKFEAELLAIDGLYKTADDVEPHLRGRPVRAWLDQDALRMTILD